MKKVLFYKNQVILIGTEEDMLDLLYQFTNGVIYTKDKINFYLILPIDKTNLTIIYQ